MFTFGLLPLPEAWSYLLMAVAIAILWAITSRPVRPTGSRVKSTDAASLPLLALAHFTRRSNVPTAPAAASPQEAPVTQEHYQASRS